MKSLYKFITESLLDIDNDGESIGKPLDDMVNELNTLKGCMNGRVTGSLHICLGPTYYKIAEFSKLLVKQFKWNNDIRMKNRNGKLLDSKTCADIIDIIASQVEVDWELDAKRRWEKVKMDFFKVYDKLKYPAIEKYRDIKNFDPKNYIEGDIIPIDKFEISIEDVNSGNTCAIIKIVYGMGESYIKGKKRWLSNDGVFKYKNANICLHPQGMGHYEIKIYKNNPLFAY